MEKLLNNVKVHRHKSTFYFGVSSENNILLPFVQFTFKGFSWKPIVQIMNNNNVLCATWLIFNFGIITNKNLEEYNLLIGADINATRNI